MLIADKILDFNASLTLDDAGLPKDVRSLNPFAGENSDIIERVTSQFYRKYYSDNEPRKLILGINPGRFGAGVTGIPFTDSIRLKEDCGIDLPEFRTHEQSSVFVYEMIRAFGDAGSFYQKYFIGAVSPLGFIRKNDKGNWVNYNFYDSREMEASVRDFIIEKLDEQIEIAGNTDIVYCLGTGKNYKYLEKLNKELNLFGKIVPLEHPRYIMQYKAKEKDKYIEKYLNALK